MILSRTVVLNIKKGLRRTSLTKLQELLESEKHAIKLLEENKTNSESRTFSHRQKIQLIEEEIQHRLNINNLSI